MAYVSLYRAYRPQTFDEVVGQNHIKKTLQNAIKLNKVSHAYLFCGPRGTGKTSLAKIFAKALNCENGPSIEPCCKCDICNGITKGMISDVIEIDAASNNGVDDIRTLRDTVNFLPSTCRYKVYIIDEVHMLSKEAFNALLKTLEEPPKYVIFILATTEPQKLLQTILSRCQRFNFESISIDDILKRLNIVAKEEKINIDNEALYQIAVSAEGGMRDALSLFDQCISYSTSDVITLNDVLDVTGNINYLNIIDLINSCISDKESNAINVLNDILSQGKDSIKVINDIIIFLRDTLLYKNYLNFDAKIMYKNEKFKELAEKLTKPLIYHFLDILNNSLNQMKNSLSKRVFLELAILKMNDVTLNTEANLLYRIETIEKNIDFILKNKPTKTVPVANFDVPTIPTVNEINKIKEEIKEEEKIETIPDDEINIEDIELILNNSNKETKKNLLDIWNQIDESTAAIVMLKRGKLVAVSEHSFLVVLQDVGFCNKVMLYENYVKIIEIFNNFGIVLDDYICIPNKVWDKIVIDYKNKYNKDTNPKPKLEPIRTGVKKRIIPNNLEESIEDKLKKEIDNIKIVEE